VALTNHGNKAPDQSVRRCQGMGQLVRVQLKCDGTRWRTGGDVKGNWRMEWVASSLHTTAEHRVSSSTTADAHTLAASSRLNWRPRLFIWTRPFRRKTKSGFCACAITFQTQSTVKPCDCIARQLQRRTQQQASVVLLITPKRNSHDQPYSYFALCRKISVWKVNFIAGSVTIQQWVRNLRAADIRRDSKGYSKVLANSQWVLFLQPVPGFFWNVKSLKLTPLYSSRIQVCAA
jgi:hypothetical protein